MIPPGLDPAAPWDNHRFTVTSWSTRPTSGVQGHRRRHRAWPARRPRPRWPSSATRSRPSRSTTRRGGRTRSPPRAASTRRRTTAATATASTASSTTRSRAATSAPARPTSTGWPRCRRTSSTSASPRACRSPASTAACSTTARFGGAQGRRTFYARGQTGQQLLLGAYQALARQVAPASVDAAHAHGAARRRGRSTAARAGIVVRDLLTGEVAVARRPRRRARHRRLLQRRSSCRPTPRRCNVTAVWRAHRRGAALRQPVLHADPPDVHPAVRRLPVEADADVASRCATTAASGCRARPATTARPNQIPEDERDYFLERRYPSFGNLVAARHRLARRQARCRRRAAASARAERRVPRLRRRHRAARRGRRRASATGTSSRCTSGSPARTRTRCRCASTRRRTTRWAGSGSTTS